MFYEDLGAKVEFVSKDYGHVPPLADADCGDGVPCGYDSIGSMLEYVLTNLKEDPITSFQPKDYAVGEKGVLRKFAQAQFLDSYLWEWSSLAPVGYIYYPN